MTMLDPFTVAQVLKRPLFQDAKVIAGKTGLDRLVRWVHVLEIMDGSSYVKGQELVLMTGVGLGNGKELQIGYIRELIESNVSALCIEMIHRFVEIPETIKRFADEHRFPIIIFDKPVSFIDITQDIHTHLIDRHHDQLLSLERISNQFLQLTLQPQGLQKILQLLYKETGTVVWLEDYLGKTIIYPEDETPVKKSFVCRPITVLDAHVGDLYIKHDRELSEYLNLIIDRAIIALAQELLRQISSEESEMKEIKKWVHDLVTKGQNSAPSNLLSLSQKGMILCAIEPISTLKHSSHSPSTHHEEKAKDRIIILRLIRMVHHAFESRGIRAWIAPIENHWAVVLVNLYSSSSSTFTQRVESIFSDLFQQFGKLPIALRYQWKVGISHSFFNITQAPQAWHQAILALSINQYPEEVEKHDEKQKSLAEPSFYKVIHYGKLHAWQLLLQMDPLVLHQFVQFQIGPLLIHDQQNGTDLVRTLETFLKTRQQKQQTAKVLFIHRQTLYYRLEQIALMLGEDWDSPSRRLALELALTVHRFLLAQKTDTI